jgi:hypothetical protein
MTVFIVSDPAIMDSEDSMKGDDTSSHRGVSVFVVDNPKGISLRIRE